MSKAFLWTFLSVNSVCLVIGRFMGETFTMLYGHAFIAEVVLICTLIIIYKIEHSGEAPKKQE